MPKKKKLEPASLQSQCIDAYVRYLYEEINFIMHLKYFENKSLLMRRSGLQTEKMLKGLQTHISASLKGILSDIVRQKMVNLVVANLHGVLLGGGGGQGDSVQPALGSVGHAAPPPTPSSSVPSGYPRRTPPTPPPFGSPGRVPYLSQLASQPYCLSCRELPVMQLLELVLGDDPSAITSLDLGTNKQWAVSASSAGDCDRVMDLSRTLWKMVGERCRCLETLIIPKELSYTSTLKDAIGANGTLTHLTLKRNVPSNMFLSLVGSSCPHLKELDIAGAEVVTDFGVVCLLFGDPEQVFMECWNREKTVGGRRSQKAFPHPHFDKPIPDPSEFQPTALANAAPPGLQGNIVAAQRASTQYLHLRRSFHEVIKDEAFGWERLPICKSLGKIRLENTKVKGDGASVVLECCPELYSLGYLVFAAAGLKQVFGYEKSHVTKFTEIFYRGPSDQKLLTIGNCCPSLTTMFLGSNNVRRMNVSVFERWQSLQYLTLENIVVADVTSCLECIGRQLKGLKVQCLNFDLTDVALHCPELQFLVIQKEGPKSDIFEDRLCKRANAFPKLREFEVTSPSFSKSCFRFVMTNSPALRSVKILHVPGLRRADLECWVDSQPQLRTLLVFRAPELTRDAVDLLLQSLPALERLGDFASFDVKRPQDIKRFQNKIQEEGWDLTLVDSENQEEKHFTKQLSLHWFYLTGQAPTRRSNKISIH